MNKEVKIKMKHLKKFEAKQEIKKKNLQETIDEVLDSLSKKGELSESEKEFMEAVSKEEVTNVTVPNMTGNFWQDMANPHNIGTLWQDNDGVWKRLMSIEEEEDKKLSEIEDSDERYHRKHLLSVKRYLTNNPGLKEDLEELLKMEIEVNKKCNEINKKYRKPHTSNSTADENNFNHAIDYATNGTMDSLLNQFGDYGESDEDYDVFIYNPKKI